MALTVYRGGHAGSAPRAGAGALVALMEASRALRADFLALADRVPFDTDRHTKLCVMAAFQGAHVSRVLARLAVLGVPHRLATLPAPATSYREAARLARRVSEGYRAAGATVREAKDLASAWVCELNHKETEDVALTLEKWIAVDSQKEASR